MAEQNNRQSTPPTSSERQPIREKAGQVPTMRNPPPPPPKPQN